MSFRLLWQRYHHGRRTVEPYALALELAAVLAALNEMAALEAEAAADGTPLESAPPVE
jgi:hypothetical protein